MEVFTSFQKIPAQRHFVIREIIPQSFAMPTVNVGRDVETPIVGPRPGFLAEIARLKRARPSTRHHPPPAFSSSSKTIIFNKNKLLYKIFDVFNPLRFKKCLP
ncbi:MAG: hypothetical protein LBC91_01820 [Candidatus Accumulibacter sp.]|jgi:hypothetical protein|nr:hypothetical protein [Accumulibacter sp.]